MNVFRSSLAIGFLLVIPTGCRKDDEIKVSKVASRRARALYRLRHRRRRPARAVLVPPGRLRPPPPPTRPLINRHLPWIIALLAALFSFTGSVLGGIRADQSWGRFWGWDPKENGALLIVLWCALILHARWGGYIRQRGLMAMAIFGNAITAFSWFGVNMLGVGLHSYGFMDKAFPWLVGFIVSQFLLVLLTRVPLHCWRSFRAPSSAA
jgi:hypothetical protein